MINDATLTEGNSGTTNAVFTVTLSPSSTQTVTVGYATADGTALAGSDYTSVSGTLTFSPSQTSKTVSVAVKGDTAYEADETFYLTFRRSGTRFLPHPSLPCRTQQLAKAFVDRPASPRSWR